MFFRHSTDKVLYPLIAAILLLVISYRPKYRLVSNMPADFFSDADFRPGQQSLGRKIAWAYWECAQMDLQWKYTYGHMLPMSPPPEFHIDAKVLGATASDPAIRQLYWRRLQQAWNSPASWHKAYELDSSWAHDPISTGGQWLRDKMAALFSLH